MSLFIILHNCESTILADSLTNLGGVVSGHVAFLMFMFLGHLLMLETSALSISKASVSFRLFLIYRILWCFSYFLMILITILKLSSQFLKLLSTGFSDVFSTISRKWLLKISTSSFSSSIILSLFSKVIELLEKELLFVRNGLTKFRKCLLFEKLLLVHFRKYYVFAFLQSELHFLHTFHR